MRAASGECGECEQRAGSLPQIAIVDADGHVNEGMYGRDIAEFLPPPYREARRIGGVFPPLDHLHNEPVQWLPGSVDTSAGAGEWRRFMQETGIQVSVLYPTFGLSIGVVTSRDWAVALCKAYNDWLFEKYLRSSPSFKGMALIPLQDVASAVAELRRAVEQLGMLGAMLPANGLKANLGSKEYWPVYREAERLGCALAIHGGAGSRLGLDQLDVRPASHALAHPFALLASCASIVFNGVYDRFPGVRIAFLEGGVAWLLLALERFDRSYDTHVPFNPRGELLALAKGDQVSGYLRRLMAEGRFLVGCEGEEPDIGYAVQRLGASGFMFSSDFPHEVNSAMCRREIAELLRHENLDSEAKRSILAGNARAFYRL